MNSEEKRIHSTISAANPLLDEDFCNEVRKSYLLYGDERLPRRIKNMRLAAEIWAAKNQPFGPLRVVEHTAAAEPNFHALLADAQHLLDCDELPCWFTAGRWAENSMSMLYRRRVNEIGLEQVYQELRREYLLAVEQLAKAGFTGSSVNALARISGLSRVVARS